MRTWAREAAAVASDRVHGAREIALRMARVLARFRGDERDLERMAHAALRRQPCMAPLWNLFRVAFEAAERGERPGPAAHRFGRALAHGTRRAAANAARLIPGGRVATYSRSSTVAEALRLAAQRRPLGVAVSEGLPAREGELLAEDLARVRGVRNVVVVPDAEVAAVLDGARLLVVGADAVGTRSFVNKTGTAQLVRAARRRRVPVLVVAESSKRLPRGLAPRRLAAAAGGRFDTTGRVFVWKLAGEGSAGTRPAAAPACPEPLRRLYLRLTGGSW